MCDTESVIITMCKVVPQNSYSGAGMIVDGAPVWHSVSRRGAGCCLSRLQKLKQNGRLLYCSYQLDSNFSLFIFSWRDLKNLLTVAVIHFFGVTNWLYTTRQSDEGVQTSHWCLACFFNRELVNRGRNRLTMLTRMIAIGQWINESLFDWWFLVFIMRDLHLIGIMLWCGDLSFEQSYPHIFQENVDI